MVINTSGCYARALLREKGRVYMNEVDVQEANGAFRCRRPQLTATGRVKGA